jgi:hypothetical protein
MEQETPIRIPLEELVSSNINAAGYDTAKQILAVQFKSGVIYHYAGVSLETATAFYCAESKGRYYTAHIKGKYQAEKMTGHCPACGLAGWIGDQCVDCGTATYAPDPRKETHG